MTFSFPSHPFWEFSTMTYAAPGVSAACLTLQERHGIDVNLLLFCLWRGTLSAGPIERADLEAITTAAAEWHTNVIRPMRTARRRVKTGAPSVDMSLSQTIYRQVLDAEIACEYLEQTMLSELAGKLGGASPSIWKDEDAAWLNVILYFDIAAITLHQDDLAALRTICAAVGVRPGSPSGQPGV